MKNKILTLALCFLALAFAVQAQDKPSGEQNQPTKNEEKLTAKDYKDMLAKLKKGDTSIDFVKFRLAYTETDDYSPYGGSEERGKIMTASQRKKIQRCFESRRNYAENQLLRLAFALRGGYCQS